MRTFQEYVAAKQSPLNEFRNYNPLVTDPVRKDIIRKEVYRQICYMTEDEQIKELTQFWREAKKAGDKDAAEVAIEELDRRDIAIFT